MAVPTQMINGQLYANVNGQLVPVLNQQPQQQMVYVNAPQQPFGQPMQPQAAFQVVANPYLQPQQPYAQPQIVHHHQPQPQPQPQPVQAQPQPAESFVQVAPQQSPHPQPAVSSGGMEIVRPAPASHSAAPMDAPVPIAAAPAPTPSAAVQPQPQAQSGSAAAARPGGLAAFIGMDAFKSSAELHKEHIAKNGLSAGLRARLAVKRQGSEKTQEDREAESEHQSLDNVPLDCDNAKLVQTVGQGVAWYFTYVKFIMIVNAVLSAIALISIIPHGAAVSKGDDTNDLPSFFYLTSYSSTTRGVWQASTIAGFLWLCLVGPVYRYYVDRAQEQRQSGEGDYVEDPFEGQYSVDTEDCVDRIPYPDGIPSRREQWCRRAISAVVFAVVLILQGVINYYAQRELQRLGEATTAVVLSGVVIVVNKVWEAVCAKLTVLEAHAFYSDFRRWECFKVFTFKLVNVVVLYLVKSLVINNDDTTCPLDAMGNQFAILVIVDIFVTLTFELVFPLAMRRLCHSQEDGKSNEESKPEFILSDEYVEVTYRQFIIFLGMPVMPFLPFLGMLGSFIEYWFDKIRLLRIAGKPKRTNNTYKNVLMFFFFMMAIGVLVGYPNGMPFVLAGAGGLESKGCRVYLSSSSTDGT